MRYGGMWRAAAGLVAVLIAVQGQALELNDDGKALIREAAESYGNDMRDRPLIVEPSVVKYVNKVAKRVLPEGKSLPAGVSLSVSVVESDAPELFSYADGHIVITSGMLYAMRNEAQLAAVLSHEVAHVAEGYYIEMYQQIKAAERKQRRKAVAGAMLSGLMDVAVDYAADYQGIEESEKMMRGEASYGETMKKMAAIEAARSGYYSMKDVVESIPPADESGSRIDPRQQFEPVADAQGMQYLAMAGYDAGQASEAWAKVVRLHHEQARERERMLGPMAQQLGQMQTMLEMNMQQMRQSLGGSGLVQTPAVAPATRAEFVAKLTQMQEVREAAEKRKGEFGEASFQDFLKKALLAKAEIALADGRYKEAKGYYRTLLDAGMRSAAISYGLAKSSMGDFAFAASEADKREAERLYRDASQQDAKFAPAYKGLAELYEDWDRPADAVAAYQRYLKYAPKSEQGSIERKIKLLKRKAAR